MLELARERQKLIFVEAYADWCNICKSLERNTFRDEKVGSYFNTNFINYRFDMEQGDGLAFSDRYDVEGYPTLLFVNFKGEVVHQVKGYMAPPRLLAEAREALDPSKNQSLLALQYEAGSSDPDVLYNYALNLKANQEDYTEVARRYFDTQAERDLDEPRNWEAIRTFTTQLDSREFQYLLRKQRRFIRKYGLQPVADKIYGVLKQNVIRAAFTRDRAQLQEVLAIARDEVKDDGQVASRLRMVYAEATKDWKDYGYKTAYHFDHFTITSPKELDHAARNFYAHIDEQALLEKALAWSRQSIAIENEYYNNATYALLLAKIGQRAAAERQAFKAWQMGRLRDDVDLQEIKDLLAELGSPVE